jgi:hypothetical protein
VAWAQHFKGIYIPFFHTWASAFAPSWRQLLLVLRTEDYVASTRVALERVFRHIGVPVPTDAAWWEKVLALPISTNGARRDWSQIPPMLAETRVSVDDFYRPHNLELARFLGDDRFTWPEQTSAAGTV